MLKTEDNFFEDLGKRESSGNYKAKNRYGYLGKYQMGEAAMVDAGYYKPKRNYNNDWSGQFTGKDGVYSVEDFLNNPQAQENAQIAFKQAQWRYLQNIGATKYLGQTINGIKITPAALLGGTHIGGQGKVNDFVRSGGKIDGKDKNGVPVSEYMRKFQDYDVSGITGIKFGNTSDKATINQKKVQTSNVNTPNDINSDTNNALFKLFAEYNNYQQNNLPDLNDLMIDPLNQQMPSNNPWDIIPMAVPDGFAQATGLAASLDLGNVLQIMGISVNNQAYDSQNTKKNGLFGYKNPLTGDNRIFTREEIGDMTTDEYAKNEKAIRAQWDSIGIPTDGDMRKEEMINGGVVHVNSYTRQDGTKVRDYYRSRPSI